jgi:hypothetical protein
MDFVKKTLKPIQDMMPLIPLDGVVASLSPFLVPLAMPEQDRPMNDKIIMSLSIGVLHGLLHNVVSQIQIGV